MPTHALLRRPVASASLLALLSGCTVGPNYHAPQTPTPATFNAIAANANANPGIVPQPATPAPEALAAWWKGFGDPTLDALVARAAAGNLDLKAAAARVREARALRGISSGKHLPTLDAKGDAKRSRSSERLDALFNDDHERTFFEGGLDASWEIDVFGGVRRDVEAADADLAAAAEDERATLVSLVAEVARNYTEYRGYEQQVVLTESTIRTQAETLDLTRSRFKAGLSADLDVAQAEAQLATRQALLPAFRTAMRQSAHRLAVLLGEAPGGTVDADLATSTSIPVPPSDVPVGLPAELVRRRPDIRRAERRLAAATARVGVATADLYPKFSLTGSFSFQAGDVGHVFDMNSRAWSVGPAVRWNLFDGRRIRNSIAAADARTDQALHTYEQTVLLAFEETENALTSFMQEQARRRSLREAVTANERAVQLATDRYRSGVGDFFAVLDNQRQLFATQDQLVQSETAVSRSLIAVYKALGGGY